MIGSYDYADFGDGDISEGLYGLNGYYEADDTADDYTYSYYWTNGYDVYYGATYDADGSQGLYVGYTYTTTDENGYTSTYYVYSAEAGNPYDAFDDQVGHDYYYDYETGQYD